MRYGELRCSHVCDSAKELEQLWRKLYHANGSLYVSSVYECMKGKAVVIRLEGVTWKLYDKLLGDKLSLIGGRHVRK